MKEFIDDINNQIADIEKQRKSNQNKNIVIGGFIAGLAVGISAVTIAMISEDDTNE